MRPNAGEAIRQVVSMLAAIPVRKYQTEIAKTLDDALDYANHNEWGLAVEVLCDNLYEYDFPLPQPLLAEIERLVESVAADRRHLEPLRRLTA